jgi:general secretion pathway protein A
MADDLYNRFYRFKKSPFNITPDPRLLFVSTKHREALNHLVYGITQRKGFIQITGEVGSGKTTLCRAVLERLPDTCRTALILNPCLTASQLLATILKEFGLKASPTNRVANLQTLNDFLLRENAAGHNVVLIIDEAQDLTPELLEQIRLLSNLETHEHKLLQIVLIGQPELRDMLNHKRLRQLRQRITVRFHLEPLSRKEMDQYIHHRICVCAADPHGPRTPRFSSFARRKIYRYTGGVPRLVNAVCDKALLAGFVHRTGYLKYKHVTRAIRELEGRAAA